MTNTDVQRRTQRDSNYRANPARARVRDVKKFFLLFSIRSSREKNNVILSLSFSPRSKHKNRTEMKNSENKCGQIFAR